MAGAALQFAIAAIFVIVAGAFLVRSADRIAEITGLGRLLVGSILLAGATSLPELSVDVSAALRGLEDIAVGDLAGSCLANLLILGIADLLHKSRARMLSHAAAAHAISGAMSILLVAIAAVAALLGTAADLGSVSAGSAVVFVAYVLGLRIVFYDQQFARKRAEAEGAVAPPLPLSRRGHALRRPLAQFAAAAAVVVAAAPFVATAAGAIAELSGLGGTFVGTTLVAFSTSLPELVATIGAVRLGAFDLAVGNILGSNAFNMAMLLPVDLASSGPLLSSVSRTHAVTLLWVVIITAVVVIGQLYHVERRKRLLEPDALTVIVLVVAALITVYGLR